MPGLQSFQEVYGGGGAAMDKYALAGLDGL